MRARRTGGELAVAREGRPNLLVAAEQAITGRALEAPPAKAVDAPSQRVPFVVAPMIKRRQTHRREWWTATRRLAGDGDFGHAVEGVGGRQIPGGDGSTLRLECPLE